jgi:hypothetical protein
MAIFPVLELEEKVQVSDKTRLDGQKSFISHGAAISQVRIKPSKNDAFIDVTAPKYLDWQYDFTLDVDSTNNKINFIELAGPQRTGTISTLNYSVASLVNAIQTAMNAAGGSLIYTVTADENNKVTISANGGFSLLIDTGTNEATSIYGDIGFTGDDLSGKQSYTGVKIESFPKLVTIEVTQTPDVTTSTKTIDAFSEAGDNLYSTDFNLQVHEPDVLRYVKKGRSTFKDVHRRAQETILAWLDKEGFVDVYGNKYTKAALVLSDELKEWSTFTALRLIFEGLHNAVDDVFMEKAKRYKGLETFHRERAVLRLDTDGDGVANQFEETDIRSCVVIRR